ncbi:hypothetical protein L1987_31499 [Smallanthus sonchifolius]|uniref:Uncharacterized protein n=1 Tax=Smallanthus sonchifolius TaxID=185202 RepID=A0ACB9I537_9ASTR|nr:hypothetical protein L1987_31499 [Smallanthus sonchifolius]
MPTIKTSNNLYLIPPGILHRRPPVDSNPVHRLQTELRRRCNRFFKEKKLLKTLSYPPKIEGNVTLISSDLKQHKSGSYTLIGDAEDNELGYFDKPLPCFGFGIGWFCLLFGFIFPLLWYYATILYFRNYYQKDPRERTGFAANAIAALIFTIALLIVILIIVI